jgi:hypothetical protein
MPTGGVPTGGVLTGGISGDGGSGATGGSSTAGCPDTPPVVGDACSTALLCAYDDCAGAGRTIATCEDGTWSTETGPCDGLDCIYSASVVVGSCEAGRVCMFFDAGVPSIRCVDNTCGTGPVSYDCISGCDGTCRVYGTTDGIGIYCNPCPAEGCV